jgi:hypothetical protein
VPSTRTCNASNKKDQHNKANIMQSRQVYTIQEMVVRAYHDQLLNTQRPFPYLILLSCRFSYSEQQPPNQNEDAMDKCPRKKSALVQKKEIVQNNLNLCRKLLCIMILSNNPNMTPIHVSACN